MEEINNLYSFLNSICEFSKSDFEKSSSFFKPRNLMKGEIWIDYNKICREMAFINRGLLRSSYIDGKGNEITSCFCAPNSMASSFKSFISQSPSNLQLQAIENTELLIIKNDNLQKLYKEVPVWERLGRILMEKEYLSLWNYANSLNTEQAQERYLKLMEGQPEVVNKAPVQDIASYLGITRETLSRIRKKVVQ